MTKHDTARKRDSLWEKLMLDFRRAGAAIQVGMSECNIYSHSAQNICQYMCMRVCIHVSVLVSTGQRPRQSHRQNAVLFLQSPDQG